MEIIDWGLIQHNLIRLVTSLLLSLPIAFNREKKTRSIGLRTYPLVAIGACGFILIGTSFFKEQEAIARIVYGVITGMGFIGGGAILKHKAEVAGTANAASLWCTGCIGVAVALNRLEIALLISLSVFLIFVLKPIASQSSHSSND